MYITRKQVIGKLVYSINCEEHKPIGKLSTTTIITLWAFLGVGGSLQCHLKFILPKIPNIDNNLNKKFADCEWGMNMNHSVFIFTQTGRIILEILLLIQQLRFTF